MERIYSGAGNKRNPNPMGSDFLLLVGVVIQEQTTEPHY